MAKPDFSKLIANKGKAEFTLYAITILKPVEHFSWDTLEQRFNEVTFHADDATAASNAIADAIADMMKEGDKVEAVWFPMKLFCGNKECTPVLSDILYNREIIKLTPVKEEK